MTVERSRVSRRTVLRWSSAAVGGLGLMSVAGCGTSDDDTAEPDPLLSQAERARTDAATATTLVALVPERAEALTTIAAERTTHAETLEAEVARLEGATVSPSTAPSTSTTTSGPPPTVEQLRERLTRSQREAADLARTSSGYRAGLLASISASCAVQTVVVLP